MQNIRTFVIQHKVVSAIAGGVILFIVWYTIRSLTTTTGQTHYLLGTVTRGTLVSTITGSGQVTANQQLDLKPKVSGQVTYVGVTPGSAVEAGTLIAVIDPTDAVKAVRDAQANLDSAKLSLEKLQRPATTLTITQQQNAIDQSKQMLVTQYQSSFADITSTFLDLPAIITSLQDIDLGTEASAPSNSQANDDFYRDQSSHFNVQATEFRDAAYNDYELARTSYNQTFTDFKALPSTPDQPTVEKMLAETNHTTALMATAAKSAYNLIQFYSDQLTQNNITPKAIAATQITNLSGYQTKLQSHLTNLLSDQNSLTSNKETITEKEQTLAQTQQGADTIDVQSSQLSLQQRQNALQDAQDTLANYYIRAPFAGTVSSVAVHKYDQTGNGTAIATIVTKQQLVALSLNEVDAAKIKLADKATLTFDAIPNLTLTGSVAEIDPVGTVTQGVVSYDVKISFDAQNAQIKSSMTVNARIQTDVRPDVLTIPQSAIKTQSGQKYVLAFIPPIASSTAAAAGSQGILSASAPQQIPIEVGISDDTSTEVTSGLIEGEQIVVRTTTGAVAAQTTTTAAAGGGGRGGGFGGGGGAIRIP